MSLVACHNLVIFHFGICWRSKIVEESLEVTDFDALAASTSFHERIKLYDRPLHLLAKVACKLLSVAWVQVSMLPRQLLVHELRHMARRADLVHHLVLLIKGHW